MTEPDRIEGGVLAVLDRARDVLAEIYAKHQRAIGPFATQAQKSNGSLRAARAAVAELVEDVGQCADEIDNLVAAMAMPIPDALHMQALRSAIPDIAARLRAALARCGVQS